MQAEKITVAEHSEQTLESSMPAQMRRPYTWMEGDVDFCPSGNRCFSNSLQAVLYHVLTGQHDHQGPWVLSVEDLDERTSKCHHFVIPLQQQTRTSGVVQGLTARLKAAALLHSKNDQPYHEEQIQRFGYLGASPTRYTVYGIFAEPNASGIPIDYFNYNEETNNWATPEDFLRSHGLPIKRYELRKQRVYLRRWIVYVPTVTTKERHVADSVAAMHEIGTPWRPELHTRLPDNTPKQSSPLCSTNAGFFEEKFRYRKRRERQEPFFVWFLDFAEPNLGLQELVVPLPKETLGRTRMRFAL